MKPRTFRIDHPRVLADCLHFIDQAGTEPALHVEVREWKENRSAKQHRLYWLRTTEIGNHLGHSKDEMHEMIKEKFVTRILVRDSEGYAEMAGAIRAVKEAGMEAEYQKLKSEVIRLTSTTGLDTTQMAELLRDMEHFAAEVGAEITFPIDYEFLVYGRRKR